MLRGPLPGDPAPSFRGRTEAHPAFPFGLAAGRYTVLAFAGSLRALGVQQALATLLERHRGWFDDRRASFFGVSIDPGDEQNGLLREAAPGIRYFRDFDFVISQLYGVMTGSGTDHRYQPTLFLLDRSLRVIAALPIGSDMAAAEEMKRLIGALPDAEALAPLPQTKPQDAPVLLVARVFETDFCQRLIAHYEAAGASPLSGFMQDLDGRSVEIRDRRHKTRRDLLVADRDLQEQIRLRLVANLLPVIRQAFQFSASHIERYLVACYDSRDGGIFGPHRDDTTKATAHRRFAVTINLNDAFEGGDLVFPEFGPRTYRASIGGAVVFSCALLHQATLVRSGRRFACLPFLHDEPAERIRVGNVPFHSQKIIERA
ncbi:MAG TPA: 2OG-Fe(II) oxygenase [Rhizomicrobium sp.]|jgi:peroxiredoxin|nr:2OG-Fe(II) oxygenase [Rhizomicrobium sp.]